MTQVIPKLQMVYLAGPVDDISSSEAAAWRTNAKQLLEGLGITAFDPHMAFSCPSRITAPSIDYINRQAIMCSDGIIANLAGNGKGFGTIREIEYARSMYKAVIVITGEPIESLCAHDVIQAKTIPEAIQQLHMEVLGNGTFEPEQGRELGT